MPHQYRNPTRISSVGRIAPRDGLLMSCEAPKGKGIAFLTHTGQNVVADL